MTDAREIIAEDVKSWLRANARADLCSASIVDALEKAGYRILAPGEVERVARAISKVASGSEANWKDYCEEAHAAIRSMEVSNG